MKILALALPKVFTFGELILNAGKATPVYLAHNKIN